MLLFWFSNGLVIVGRVVLAVRRLNSVRWCGLLGV
jgi:hypothetical protein